MLQASPSAGQYRSQTNSGLTLSAGAAATRTAKLTVIFHLLTTTVVFWPLFTTFALQTRDYSFWQQVRHADHSHIALIAMLVATLCAAGWVDLVSVRSSTAALQRSATMASSAIRKRLASCALFGLIFDGIIFSACLAAVLRSDVAILWFFVALCVLNAVFSLRLVRRWRTQHCASPMLQEHVFVTLQHAFLMVNITFPTMLVLVLNSMGVRLSYVIRGIDDASETALVILLWIAQALIFVGALMMVHALTEVENQLPIEEGESETLHDEYAPISSPVAAAAAPPPSNESMAPMPAAVVRPPADY